MMVGTETALDFLQTCDSSPGQKLSLSRGCLGPLQSPTCRDSHTTHYCGVTKTTGLLTHKCDSNGRPHTKDQHCMNLYASVPCNKLDGDGVNDTARVVMEGIAMPLCPL